MTTRLKRTGQLSRSDLLDALLRDDQAASRYIARQLGLYGGEVDVKKPKQIKKEDPQQQLPENITESVESNLNPTVGLWRLVRRDKTDKQAQSDLETRFDSKPTWTQRPTIQPVFHPITEAQQFFPSVLHFLKHQRLTNSIDTQAIVHTMSRGEHLRSIPYLSRRSLGRYLQIITDRHSHLIPFWLDQTLFSKLLTTTLPDYDYNQATLLEHHHIPQTRSEHGQLQDWTPPPANSVVVVFSDLGALSDQADQRINQWLAIGRQLQALDCKLLAITPCHPDLCDNRLKTMFTLLPWEMHCHVQRQSLVELKQQADQLLTLLAPALRLEPGLLRNVRVELGRIGVQFSAAVEALLWQHADIQEASSVAATPDSQARKSRLSHFQEQPDSIKQVVLNSMRNWRGALHELVWFEEITSLDQSSQNSIPAADLTDAKQYFQYFSQSLHQPDQHNTIDSATCQWFYRFEKRLPEHNWQLPEIGSALQRITAHLHKDDQQHRTDYPVDPAHLSADELPVQSLPLYQQGERLVLQTQAEDELPDQTLSRLATLHLRGTWLLFKMLTQQQTAELDNDQQQQLPRQKLERLDAGQSLKLDPDDSNQIVLTTLSDQPGLVLRSDQETLYFSQVQRPHWASALGRDHYGLYLEFTVEDIKQRMRWIEPGTFLMGSPLDEADRLDWEDLHSVTLTQGFWLADSAVTQALWQTVMGKNPSRFNENSDNPVEKISWDDAQAFISELNLLSKEASFRLPTEAEWEYACRAGTTTPFSFGTNITTEQVNYDGDFPYTDGKKGQDRQQTVPVKSLPANPWGLYEMHGNVWEWCQDGWQEHLGNDHMINPLNDQSQEDEGVRRVVRGGSWNDGGRHVRSAIRGWDEPVGRVSPLGFRLALGH